jgi:hypothetical protein
MPEHPPQDQDVSAEAARSIERTLAADYRFWRDIIQGESERLRFNHGYEPVVVDLYPAARKGGPAFMGKTRIGHVHFRVEGAWQYDCRGNQVLRITILKDLQ